jgi:hypothetical protein
MKPVQKRIKKKFLAYCGRFFGMNTPPVPYVSSGFVTTK